MAVIYMEHPKHGTKVACMEDEARADEAQGWVRKPVAALLRPAEAANSLIRTDAAPDELESLRMRWETKFGRKPHHKKTAATLRAELEG